MRVPICVNAAAAGNYLLRIRKITELALMFCYSDTDPAVWGANLPGSPVIAVSDPLQHMTQFVIPTQRW